MSRRWKVLEGKVQFQVQQSRLIKHITYHTSGSPTVGTTFVSLARKRKLIHIAGLDLARGKGSPVPAVIHRYR